MKCKKQIIQTFVYFIYRIFECRKLTFVPALLKTRPLTVTDIPDIVSAVAQALPLQTQMDLVRSSRRKRSNPAETTQPTQTEQTSHRRRTGTPASLEPQDSTDEEDVENEDFGKQQYKLYFV